MIDPEPADIVDFKGYFSAANASFERAFAKAGQAVDLKIGDQHWRIRLAATNGAERYLRAFSHLQLPHPLVQEVALTICVWDYESSGEAPPIPSWVWSRRLPHSQESSFDNGRYVAVKSYNGFYFLLDRASRQVLGWRRQWSDLPSWEFSAPLRDLIELWFKPSDFIRLHGRAVGTKAGASCWWVKAVVASRRHHSLVCWLE